MQLPNRTSRKQKRRTPSGENRRRTVNRRLYLQSSPLGFEPLEQRQLLDGAAVPGAVAWFAGENSADDLVGNNNGQVQGNITYVDGVDGKVGKAISFDGSSAINVYKRSGVFDPGSGDFSIEGWVKFDATVQHSQSFLALNYGGVPWYGLLVTPGGNAAFYVRDNNDNLAVVVGATALGNNAWHHVAAVRNGATFSVYVDGQSDGTGSFPAVGSVVTGTHYVRLGAANTGPGNDVSPVAYEDPYHGLLDEISFFRRALTPAEVQLVYSAGSFGKTPLPGPVAWYAGEGNANDQVGNNNGQLQNNGVTFVVGRMGQAFSFDGNSAINILKQSNVFEPNSGDFTIDLWLRFDLAVQPNRACLLTNYGGVPVYQLMLENSGRLEFDVRDNGGSIVTVYGATPLGNDAWHHVTAVRSGSDFSVFVDGQVDGHVTDATIGSVVPTNSYVRIGATNTNGGNDVSPFAYEHPYHGFLDEVKVFPRALPPAEIANHPPAVSIGSVTPGTLSGPNDTVVVVGTATDADVSGPYQAVINWGDSYTDEPITTSGAGTFTATHVYAHVGRYTLLVKSTDTFAVTGWASFMFGDTNESPPPGGDEFPVNTITGGDQHLPSAATLSDGSVVVVWCSNPQDGFGDGAYGRVFSASGTAMTGEFRIADRTIDDQTRPRVAADSAGNFVVVWQEWGIDSDGWGIAARAYHWSGTELTHGSQTVVNARQSGYQSDAWVDVSTDGNLVVTWAGPDSSGDGIFARQCSLNGLEISRVGDDDIVVNTTVGGNQGYPIVSTASDNSFVIVWNSNEGPAHARAQRFYATGTKDGAECDFGGGTALPSVTHGTANDYVVSWTSGSVNGDVYVQRFSTAGGALGLPLRVNTYVTDTQSESVVAVLRSGFVVAWTSNGQDGSGDGVFAQELNTIGVPTGPEFAVNRYTGDRQSTFAAGAIAPSADGGAMIFWTSVGQDGSGDGVYGRRFGSGNHEPHAGVTEPNGIDEGNSLTLDASESFDVDNDPLSFSWDVNGDGTFGDANGVQPTLTWSQLSALGIDGKAVLYDVTVRVDDGHGHVVPASTTLSVANLAPMASGSGPTVGVTEESLSFAAFFSDPNPADALSVVWQFGDGSGVSFSGADPMARAPSHRYDLVGSYPVTLTVSDDDGGSVTIAIATVDVTIWRTTLTDVLIGGTTGNDLFTVTPGATVGAYVIVRNDTGLDTFSPSAKVIFFGGDGTDQVELNGTNLNNAFDINATRIGFNGVDFVEDLVETRTINALGSTDTITVYGGAATVNGGPGADTLVSALSADSVWHITSQNAGDLNGQVVFSSIERLVGGIGADSFEMANGVGVSSTIDGGGGTDSLNYSAYSTPVTVILQSGAATKTGGTSEIEHFVGGFAIDTLIGPNTVNAWTLASTDAGDINGVNTYRSFENVTGGTQVDRFVVLPGGTVSGTLSGGGAADVIDYSSYGGGITVDLESRSASGVAHFASIARLVGTAGIDTFIGANVTNSWTFTATGGSVGGTAFDGFENWQGGSATDTLHGDDIATTWNIAGPNSGSVYAIGFWGMENLTGGSQVDTFVLRPAGSIGGTINGGAASDVLDFSQGAGPTVVNLQSLSATGVAAFASISQLVGSTAADSLIGADNANTWNLSSGNGGSVDTYTFSSFESLIGGSAADTFRVAQGVTFTGSVDGGSGADKLDYAAYTTAVQVDLAAGTATGVGAATGVENVTGGDGNDLIVGSAANNVLSGGNGNDILLGGAGDDTLSGNNGRDLVIGGSGTDLVHGNATEDILIGGGTIYLDETAHTVDQAALAAIMAEWSRTDLSYGARIAHLTGATSGGLNGSYRLNALTVLEDGAVDTLYGDAGLDWFLASEEDQINSTAGETVTGT